MSETKLATKADLKEMYDRMLPYLGGSADAGFTPVGTIIALMSNHAPANYLICDGTVYNIADYPELANHFLNEFGSKNYFGGDGTTTFAVPTKSSSSNDEIYCIATKNIYLNPSNDYSTDEKVVGTWIDGKTIYQKTIEITTGSSSATKSISTGIANISAIISAAGFIQNSTQNIPMNTTWSSNEANVIFNITSSDTTMVVKAGHSDWQNKTAYITLKYTKNT